MAVRLQRCGVDGSMLSKPGDENRFLTATPHRFHGNLPKKLQVRPANPRDKKMQQWVKDTSASNQFSREGLFAICTGYYLSLPNPRDDFNMLELKLVRAKPIELVCQSLQWEETEGGVITKPAAIGRRSIEN